MCLFSWSRGGRMWVLIGRWELRTPHFGSLRRGEEQRRRGMMTLLRSLGWVKMGRLAMAMPVEGAILGREVEAVVGFRPTSLTQRPKDDFTARGNSAAH